MEFEDKRYSLESGIAKGRPLPKWALNEPENFPGDYFYITAFHELSTCRNSGMDIGPIPWITIVNYAQFKELEKGMIPCFVDIIMQMDQAYINKVRTKNK